MAQTLYMFALGPCKAEMGIPNWWLFRDLGSFQLVALPSQS